MKKKTKTKIAISATFTAFVAWVFFRPVNYSNDTFFKEKALDVPTTFIISHESPFWLMAVQDNLVLKIPTNKTVGIQNQFVGQKQYYNASRNLPRHYKEFVSGQEKFFPACPTRFQAGSFVAFDGSKSSDGIPNSYYCRFLFDQDAPDFTYLYLSSLSPID